MIYVDLKSMLKKSQDYSCIDMRKLYHVLTSLSNNCLKLSYHERFPTPRVMRPQLAATQNAILIAIMIVRATKTFMTSTFFTTSDQRAKKKKKLIALALLCNKEKRGKSASHEVYSRRERERLADKTLFSASQTKEGRL